jgi:hypothetical protein
VTVKPAEPSLPAKTGEHMQSGRAILWLIAGLVAASGSSYASNLLAHPSPDIVSATVMNFRKALHAGGMKLVSSNIAQCYVDAKEVPQTVVDCMLWDIAALNVDAIVRKEMIDRGVADPGPATSYQAWPAFQARVDKWRPLAFGSEISDARAYFGTTPSEIADNVVKLSPGDVVKAYTGNAAAASANNVVDASSQNTVKTSPDHPVGDPAANVVGASPNTTAKAPTVTAAKTSSKAAKTSSSDSTHHKHKTKHKHSDQYKHSDQHKKKHKHKATN